MACGDGRRCRCDGRCGYQAWKARWETLLPRMERAAIDRLRLRAIQRPSAKAARAASDDPPPTDAAPRAKRARAGARKA